MITKCPKPPKYNKKRQKTGRFNERGNHASKKRSESGDNYSNQKIYASMARMFGNYKSYSIDFGDRLQLTNFI